MPSGLSKPVIGILGGIGAGKSFVARQFQKLGCGVVDADALVRQAYADPAVIEQLRQRWGDGVAGADGSVNRGRIAEIVFNDPAQRQWLESLVHPLVHRGRRRLREQYDADPAVAAIVEDTPLLLEKGLAAECDALVFVEADEAVRRRRVAASRGWTPDQLAQREKSQWGLDIKRRHADYVVENNGDGADCLDHVRRVLSRIAQEPDSPR